MKFVFLCHVTSRFCHAIADLVVVAVVGPPIPGTKVYDDTCRELKGYLPMLEMAVDKLSKENPREW